MAILDVLPGVGVARDPWKGALDWLPKKEERLLMGTQRAYNDSTSYAGCIFATGIVCAGIVLIVLSKSFDDPLTIRPLMIMPHR